MSIYRMNPDEQVSYDPDMRETMLWVRTDSERSLSSMVILDDLAMDRLIDLTFQPLLVHIMVEVGDDLYAPVQDRGQAEYAAAILIPRNRAAVEPINPEFGLWQVQVPPNLDAAAAYGMSMTIDAMGYRITVETEPR